MKKITISILLLASVLLAACAAATPTQTPTSDISAPEEVVAEGHIIPAQDLRLVFPARGRVSDILVSEGQKVNKGDVLVRLGDREQAEAALASAKLELTQAQNAYDEFTRNEGLSAASAWEAYQQAQVVRAAAQKEWEAVNPNDVQDEVDDAEADAQDKKKALEDAQDEFDKYKDLKTDNATRRKAEDDLLKAQADYNESLRKVEELKRKVDAPRAALDAALANEAETLRKYENTKDSLDPEQKALIEARLENAKAQVSAAETALANFDLVAPFAGVVTDVNVTVGELIGSEKYAVQMADFSAWYIETSDLTELEVVNVSEGQQVSLVPDALIDTTLTGTVESISLSSKTQGGDVLYTVKIKLDDTDPALRWGMTVEVTFPPK
jgi:multidrug resistance efflux pump